jgi:nucleotide-binding universal stress UspA family protein
VRETPQPIVVAFDGSEESATALEAAVALFPGRQILVATVWEPGLAMVLQPAATGEVTAYSLPSDDQVATIDRIERHHAAATASEGARTAHELGASAQPLPIGESGGAAPAIMRLADEHDAAAIVVGSRGFGAIRAKLLGSTSRRLVHDSRRPILVVRDART